MTEQIRESEPSQPPTAETIGQAAERILGELAPAELAVFPDICHDFFTRPAVHRQISRAVLRGRGRTAPTATGSGADQLIAEVLLVVLEKIAKDVLIPAAGKVGHWWRNRSRRHRKAVTAATPVPKMTAIEAAQAGTIIKEIAVDAGLPEETAQLLANRLTAALSPTDG
jgi:hypothetical protein